MNNGVDQADGLRHLTGGRPRARVIAVASGKGGVGKTFLTTNLAVLAGRRGLRVLLVDGDLALANVDVVLSARAPRTIDDVLHGRCSIVEALARGPYGIHLLAAGSGVRGLAQLDDLARGRLLDEISTLESSFDVILIDCGAGIGDNVLFLASAATSCVLVLTPEPTALVDAYATAKALSEVGTGALEVVVNCATSDTDARATFGRLAAVVGRFLPMRLRYLGGVLRDDAVRKAVMARRPVVDFLPGARATAALAAVERSLLEQLPPEPLGGRLAVWWDRHAH
jgi:flagellar biosynthesis protein FlhG